MRRDVVKGAADSMKKQRYLEANQKMKAKEKKIEEQKALIDAMIEKRRLDLEERQELTSSRLKKEYEDSDLKARKDKYQEERDHTVGRVLEKKEQRI